jgi:hypothetical protein
MSEPYLRFKQTTCEAVLPGIVEMMAIAMLIGFFNLFNTIFGVCFVVRNKVDVPVYKPPAQSKKSSHNKKHSKKEDIQ